MAEERDQEVCESTSHPSQASETQMETETRYQHASRYAVQEEQVQLPPLTLQTHIGPSTATTYPEHYARDSRLRALDHCVVERLFDRA